jgi:hypothetical protein
MNNSEKIREHFRKFPNADVGTVAAKFQAHKPMVYKLRKEVKDTGAVNTGLAKLDWTAKEDKKDSLIATLTERGTDYGKFKDGAALMQGMKRLLADHAAAHNKTFADDQWEALEMIVHKIGRIVNGNPDKIDHWVDIAGYAKLVADRLEGVER